MKKIIFLSLIALISLNGFSQVDDYKAENEGWLVNLEEAYELSEKTGKPILANFTGSDWCGWCKKLTASVFSKEEFKTWADKNVVLLEVDFPRRKTIPANIKQQNAELQQVFKVRGYPTIWVFNLDKDAKTGKWAAKGLGKTSYQKTVKLFTDEVDKMLKADTQAAEYEASNEGWLVKMEEAYELSQKTGKPILANFTGSDWCGWCKKLTGSVFSKEEFKAWADKNVVLLEVDFPRRKAVPVNIKQQNAQLQKIFKVPGYPTVCVFTLDKDSKTGEWTIEELGQTSYQKTVKLFTDEVDKILESGK